MKQHRKFWFCVEASCVVFLGTMLLVHSDSSFHLRFLTFFCWIFSLSIVPCFVFFSSRKKLSRLSRNNAFLLLLFLSLLFSFSLLKAYPFVAIYDQVRGAGLYAAEINQGLIKNFFGYDIYQAHGLIIPLFTSLFYHFFHASVLTYRIPAAGISVLDCLLLYFLSRRQYGKSAAFFSGLVLLVLPLHLYYARTELVVLLSSFFMTLLLCAVSFVLDSKRLEWFAMLGLTAGFATGIYDPLKTVSLITIVFTLCFCAYTGYTKKHIRQACLTVVFVLVFAVIGFGPKLFFTTPQIFFHANESFVSHNMQLPQSFSLFSLPNRVFEEREMLLKNYVTSLLVYAKVPTVSPHYPDFSPILSPFLSLFFLLGFFQCFIIKKDVFSKLLCFYTLIIPLTNSALTNSLNNDNRLLPALPVAAIITGYGITSVISVFGKKQWKKSFGPVVATGFTMMLCMQGFLFFWNEPATKQYSSYEYLTMDMLYFVQSHAPFQTAGTLCILIPKQRYDYYNTYGSLLLTAEQYQYFLPGKTVLLFSGNDTAENSFYLSYSCQGTEKERYTLYTYCDPYQKFVCAPSREKLTLFVEKPHTISGKHFSAFTGVPLVINPTPRYIP